MPSFENLNQDELKAELERTEKKLEDARQERDFMGKLSGAHISASELSRLDLEISRYEDTVSDLKSRIG